MYTFLLLLVAIVWGSTFFIIKDTVETVNEYFIVFSRTAIAAIFMLVVLWIKDKKALFQKTAIIRGGILGLLLAFTYVPQTIGLKFTSTGHSAFITGAAIVLVPLFLFFFYKYRIKKNDIVSVVIVMIGLFLLTYDFETNINKGDLITFITTASYAMNIVLAGRYVKKTNTLAIVTYQFLGASIISLLAYGFTNPEPLVLTQKSIWSIVYLGVIGTLFCYFVTVWVQKYVSSIRVAIIFSLEPIFAAGFGFVILKEILSIRELAGAFIILFAVMAYQLWEYRQKFTRT